MGPAKRSELASTLACRVFMPPFQSERLRFSALGRLRTNLPLYWRVDLEVSCIYNRNGLEYVYPETSIALTLH